MARALEPEATVRRTDPDPGNPSATEQSHLLDGELAQRWRLSRRTLQRWRRDGSGPAFLRLGRRVAYRLSDVERFETEQLHSGDRA